VFLSLQPAPGRPLIKPPPLPLLPPPPGFRFTFQIRKELVPKFLFFSSPEPNPGQVKERHFFPFFFEQLVPPFFRNVEDISPLPPPLNVRLISTLFNFPRTRHTAFLLPIDNFCIWTILFVFSKILPQTDDGPHDSCCSSR